MFQTNLTSSAAPMGSKHPLQYFFDVPHTNPNRSIILLFRTVIVMAIYDALKGCKKSRSWLLLPSKDLQEVADYADVTCDEIKRIATQILKQKIAMPPYRIWRYLWADLQQKNV